MTNSLEKNKAMVFPNINSHEFTLSALMEIVGTLDKIESKQKADSIKNGIKIGLLATGLYMVFDNLNRRVKTLERKMISINQAATIK